MIGFREKEKRGIRDDPQVSGLHRGWEQRSREAGKEASRAPPHPATAQMALPTISKADHCEASVISEDGRKSSEKQGECLLQSPWVGLFLKMGVIEKPVPNVLSLKRICLFLSWKFEGWGRVHRLSHSLIQGSISWPHFL